MFDDLSTPQTNSYSESLLKQDPWKKNPLEMTLPHPYHSSHFLSVVGDSVALYLNNSNPYPHDFPGYIRSIYVHNNPKKVHYVIEIVKSKLQRENQE